MGDEIRVAGTELETTLIDLKRLLPPTLADIQLTQRLQDLSAARQALGRTLELRQGSVDVTVRPEPVVPDIESNAGVVGRQFGSRLGRSGRGLEPLGSKVVAEVPYLGVSAGELGVSDELERIQSGATGITVYEVWKLSYGGGTDHERLKRALEIPTLGEEWRSPMLAKLTR